MSYEIQGDAIRPLNEIKVGKTEIIINVYRFEATVLLTERRETRVINHLPTEVIVKYIDVTIDEAIAVKIRDELNYLCVKFKHNNMEYFGELEYSSHDVLYAFSNNNFIIPFKLTFVNPYEEIELIKFLVVADNGASKTYRHATVIECERSEIRNKAFEFSESHVKHINGRGLSMDYEKIVTTVQETGLYKVLSDKGVKMLSDGGFIE